MLSLAKFQTFLARPRFRVSVKIADSQGHKIDFLNTMIDGHNGDHCLADSSWIHLLVQRLQHRLPRVGELCVHRLPLEGEVQLSKFTKYVTKALFTHGVIAISLQCELYETRLIGHCQPLLHYITAVLTATGGKATGQPPTGP